MDVIWNRYTSLSGQFPRGLPHFKVFYPSAGVFRSLRIHLSIPFGILRFDSVHIDFMFPKIEINHSFLKALK